MQKYDPKKIESKWQDYWEEHGTFVADDKSKKPKSYILIEFPYPSGEGLHMGHLRPYTAGDVYSRYLRLKGHEVMYPIGWDAFGLPAENFAIKNKVHPRESTKKNIENAKRQIQSWGIGFDWSREVNTTDPEYYKWTQWIFLEFYKAGLAYEATGLINWCPKDKTGLANEEVINGKCERCGSTVEKKELRQWYLRITEYAEKLLEGLKKLNWPEQVKLQQGNWIGKSHGSQITFAIKDYEVGIDVFTTRPDTLFGATYLVLAPEHPFVKLLIDAETEGLELKNGKAVEKYLESAKEKTEIQRSAIEKEKTGVELEGISAINPATGEEIPVWVADYVLPGYGTGAIMAVPNHDERDFAFAQKYELPVRCVIDPGAGPELGETLSKEGRENEDLRQNILVGKEVYIGQGLLINSGKFNGYNSEHAVSVMGAAYGKITVQYKLRDWVFSRQRYWGEPIPIIHCPNCGTVPVPEKDLPVLLPEVSDYEPTGTGESPLAAIDEWVNVTCPKCEGEAKRETNTMPQWAGSSWYFLRYTDPHNQSHLAKEALLKYWMPVDVYFGGMEHTTLHLLYSRFWNLFLHDQGIVPVAEPYLRRIPHGIILAPDGEKMSKSRGNVVNPDDIVNSLGADTLRMYELFLGPHEQTVSWSDGGIIGVKRFLDRAWAWVGENKDSKAKESDLVKKEISCLVKKIGEDIEAFRFNTAVSSFMEFLNTVKNDGVSNETLKNFLVLLYPFAPHITEELNEQLGGSESLQQASWPAFDPGLLTEVLVKIVVQINGKVKDHLEVKAGSSEEEVKTLVMNLEKIKNAIAGETVKRSVFVKDKLINLVV